MLITPAYGSLRRVSNVEAGEGLAPLIRESTAPAESAQHGSGEKVYCDCRGRVKRTSAWCRFARRPATLALSRRKSLCDSRCGSAILPAAAIETLVSRLPVSTDISGQMILLGTGTSVGVPAIGCGCDVCRSTNPKNRRTRCSAILGLPGRQSADRHGSRSASAVASRGHRHRPCRALHARTCRPRLRPRRSAADAVLPRRRRCRCTAKPMSRSGFASRSTTPSHRPTTCIAALCRSCSSTRSPPSRSKYSAPASRRSAATWAAVQVLGFRIGNVAYCTDVNAIPPESMETTDRPRLLGARCAAAQGARHPFLARRSHPASRASSRRVRRTSRTCRTSWNTRRPMRACPKEWHWPTTASAFHLT